MAATCLLVVACAGADGTSLATPFDTTSSPATVPTAAPTSGPSPTADPTAQPPPTSAVSPPPLTTLPPPAVGTPDPDATTPPLPDEPVEPVPTDAALTPALQAVLDEWLAGDDAPGAVLGVRLGDGRTAVVAAGETDFATGRAVDPGHRFRIGSITKTFVAVVVVQLAGAGLLDLDDPVARHLPAVPWADEVTVRQLLDHTSGVPDFAAVPEYRFALLRAPGRPWTSMDVLGLVDERPLDFAPGTSWDYSNTNYTLLGMLAEEVSGEPLGELLRLGISDPLDLRSTYLEELEPSPGPAVSGHFDLDGDGEPDNVRAVPYTALVTSGAAAGGISASALDVLDFASALFRDELAGGGGLAEMMSIAPAAADYGAGLAVFRRSGLELWGHSGALPGFSTLLVHSLDAEVTVIAMANATGADVDSLVDDALAAVPGRAP